MLKEKGVKERVKEGAQWSCYVETLRFSRPTSIIVRTVFAVEQQSFILAEGSGQDSEEVRHCEFLRDMFIKALSRIGVPPSTGPTERSEERS